MYLPGKISSIYTSRPLDYQKCEMQFKDGKLFRIIVFNEITEKTSYRGSRAEFHCMDADAFGVLARHFAEAVTMMCHDSRVSKEHFSKLKELMYNDQSLLEMAKEILQKEVAEMQKRLGEIKSSTLFN